MAEARSPALPPGRRAPVGIGFLWMNETMGRVARTKSGKEAPLAKENDGRGGLFAHR
jgi:hypothetical protein